MTLGLQETELYGRIAHPDNLVFSYLNDERLNKDIWDIRQDLAILAESAQIYGKKTVNFQGIGLPWLQELTKLAVLIAVGNRRWSLMRMESILRATKKFSAWLIKQGYLMPSALTAEAIQQWGQQQTVGQKMGIQGLLIVWQEMGCLQLPGNLLQYERPTNQPKVISEDIKYKIDLALKQFAPPIYLVFKLIEALGMRSIEVSKIPIDCLRQREGVPRIRLCTAKQDSSKQEQDLPSELVELVQQQQQFIYQEFGSDFQWLFSNWTATRKGFSAQGWPPTFEYHREQVKAVNNKLNLLLKRLIEENQICNDDASLVYVTTHMFRRTFGTVADHMGKRPDQIQHGLRHANPDMQDSYVYVSPKQQEKRIERVLVDKDGKRTNYCTDTEREFVRREWAVRQIELGVCTRPSIMKDCEFEHVCLSCQHVRFATEHLPQLLERKAATYQLLEQCCNLGQSDSRRANSARQLISIIEPIIANLQPE